MEILTALFLTAVGFTLLIKGADWLVEGATDFARKYHVSELVIGLTIVSFGTSMPELLVNVIASFKESADIAIGNVVGSNISNTLLILGTTAAITPLAVKRSTVFKEIPFCLLASVILFFMANDLLIDGYDISELGRGDGLAFIGFFIIFIYYTFGIRKQHADSFTKPSHSMGIAFLLFIGGLLALSAGGELTVRGAIGIAQGFGISEALIGLTIVALGTSLPELVTSVVAAMKGRTDISIGNIVGSNIFNILWILGVSSIIRPLPFSPAINTDLLVVVASVVILFIFIHTGRIHNRLFFWWKQKEGHMLSRLEGAILLTSYFVYIGYLVLREVGVVV